MRGSLARRVCAAALVAAALGVFETPAAAQTADAGSVRELAAIRSSLDQIVVILRELVQQNGKRDRVAALTQRIQSATRRLAPSEDELRGLRDRRLKEEAELTGLRGSLDALAEMAKQDVTGSAAQAFDNERQRLNASIAQKTASIAQLANEQAVLEADVSSKRASVEELERALDRELTTK